MIKKAILIFLGICLLASPCLAFSYTDEARITPEAITVGDTVTVDFTMTFPYSEAEILQHFIASTKLVDVNWTIQVFKGGINVATKKYSERSISMSYFDFAYQESSDVKIHMEGKVSETDAGKSINVFSVYTQKAKRNNPNEILQTYTTPEMFVFTQNEIQNMYDEIDKQIINIKAKLQIFKDSNLDVTALQNDLDILIADFESFKAQTSPDLILKDKIEKEYEKLQSDIKGYEKQIVESNLQWAYQNLPPNNQIFVDKYNAVLTTWQNGEPNMEASIELVNTIKQYSAQESEFNPSLLLIPLGILGVLFIILMGGKRRKGSTSGRFKEDTL